MLAKGPFDLNHVAQKTWRAHCGVVMQVKLQAEITVLVLFLAQDLPAGKVIFRRSKPVYWRAIVAAVGFLAVLGMTGGWRGSPALQTQDSLGEPTPRGGMPG